MAPRAGLDGSPGRTRWLPGQDSNLDMAVNPSRKDPLYQLSYLIFPVMFTVYVLRNDGGTLYAGHTSDLEKRLEQHLNGLSRWTKARGPWRLVHQEQFDTRAAAMKREKALKSGRANQALRELIESKANAPSRDEAS